MRLDYLTDKETLPEQAKRLGVTDIDFVLTPEKKLVDEENDDVSISWEVMETRCDDAIKCFHDLLSRLLKQ